METFRNKPIKKHSQNPFKNNEGIKNCKKKKKKKKNPSVANVYNARNTDIIFHFNVKNSFFKNYFF